MLLYMSVESVLKKERKNNGFVEKESFKPGVRVRELWMETVVSRSD